MRRVHCVQCFCFADAGLPRRTAGRAECAAGRQWDGHDPVSTQLVVETVGVKDKKGNPIEGLTAKDFTVTEDGVPQEISFCEHQELPETPSPRP